MSFLKFILKKVESLFYLKLKYIFYGSIVVAKGPLKIGKRVKIKRSKIFIEKDSSFCIGDSCLFDRVYIRLSGDVVIGNNNIIEQKGTTDLLRIVGKGTLVLGNNNRIRSAMWIRFNGKLSFGNYTNINEGSEVRCDELVEIGSYNQISYNVMIWDTNTHNMYTYDKRRDLTHNYFPSFGVEIEKPKSKPIIIGNDCWISKNVAILKGTSLEDKCIVGFGAILADIKVTQNSTIFLDLKIRQITNSL